MADKVGNKVKIIVITPYKCFYEAKASSIVVPSLDGELGIMAGHAPLVVALKPGICDVRIDKETKHFTVSEGFVEISQNMVMVVCNSAEWPEDLSVKRIHESFEGAKADEEQCMLIQDANARKYALKESAQRINRVNARIQLIKKYGDDHQKERLIEYGFVKA